MQQKGALSFQTKLAREICSYKSHWTLHARMESTVCCCWYVKCDVSSATTTIWLIAHGVISIYLEKWYNALETGAGYNRNLCRVRKLFPFYAKPMGMAKPPFTKGPAELRSEKGSYGKILLGKIGFPSFPIP